jgi:hypothetical protein
MVCADAGDQGLRVPGVDDRHRAQLRTARRPARGPCPRPFSVPTMQTFRVAWVAAEIEAAGHQWHAPRERALARDRWGVQVNNERGGQGRRLPDLMYWPVPGVLPVAVVVEHGLPKPRRERAALEGWQGSIAAGQYAQVRYVTDPSSARRLEDGAARIGRNPRPWTPGGRRQRRRLWRPPKRLPNARSSSGNCSVKKNSLAGGRWRRRTA